MENNLSTRRAALIRRLSGLGINRRGCTQAMYSQLQEFSNDVQFVKSTRA